MALLLLPPLKKPVTVFMWDYCCFGNTRIFMLKVDSQNVESKNWIFRMYGDNADKPCMPIPSLHTCIYYVCSTTALPRAPQTNRAKTIIRQYV